jgi:hypothetical protein
MMRAPAALVFASSLGVACLAMAPRALAFCQTTTCLPDVTCQENPEQCCEWDRNGCDTNGIVITWPSDCASYAIHEAGSPLRGITAAQLSDTVDDAFASWTHASCGSSTPSINFQNFGLSECDEVEVNSITSGPNANVWMFRDEAWPHADLDESGSQVNASALALTTVTFNWKTGELLDADVELNSAQGDFTIGDDAPFIDLLAIATHEAGHFLGLDHTNDTTATMAPGYVPHTIDQRTLALDDELGICKSYPHGRETTGTSCDPYGTYSDKCASAGGCSISGVPTRTGSAGPVWLTVLGAALGVRRSVRRRAVGA